jgi:hypothetical protein
MIKDLSTTWERKKADSQKRLSDRVKAIRVHVALGFVAECLSDGFHLSAWEQKPRAQMAAQIALALSSRDLGEQERYKARRKSQDQHMNQDNTSIISEFFKATPPPGSRGHASEAILNTHLLLNGTEFKAELDGIGSQALIQRLILEDAAAEYEEPDVISKTRSKNRPHKTHQKKKKR